MDGATEIGKVAVKVVPDTDDFRRDAKRELDAIEASLDKLKVEFEADVDDLLRQVEEAIDDAEKMAHRDPIHIPVHLDLDDREVRRVEDKLDDIDADIAVDLENTSVRYVQARLAWLGRARIAEFIPKVNEAAAAKVATTLAALSGLRSINNIFSNFTDWLRDLDKAIPKMGLLGGATANLASFLMTATSNTLVFGQSLAHIGGLVLAMPGILGGMAFGVGGLITVMLDFNKVLPEVSTMLSRLQDQMSSAFWKRAAGPIREFIGILFPQFAAGMRETSRALGDFFGDISGASIKAFNGELKTMFGDLAESIRISGDYADSFLGVMQKLGSVGAGNLPKLATWFGEINESFDDWLDEKGAAGLQEFVDRGVSALKDLGNVARFTGSTLSGLADAAERAGGSSLRMMAETMERVARTVNGNVFQRNMTLAFKGAHDAMTTIADKSGPAFEKFMKRLARTLGAVLPRAGEAAGVALEGLFEALGSKRVQTTVIGLFDSLVDASESLAPALPEVAQGLSGIFDVAGALGRGIANSLGPALENLGPAVDDLAQELVPVVDSLTSFTAVLLDLTTGALAGIPTPLLAAGVALGGMLFAANKASIAFGALKANLTGMTGPFMQLRTDLTLIRQGLTLTGQAAVDISSRFYGAIDRMVGRVAKGVLAIGALALASTEAGDAISNTLNLGLAGGMIGGFKGGALGALTGLFLDLSHASDDLDSSMKSLDRTMNAQDGTFSKMSENVRAAGDAWREYGDSVGAGEGAMGRLKATFSSFEGFTRTLSDSFSMMTSGTTAFYELGDSLIDANAQILNSTEALNKLGLATGYLDEYSGSVEALDGVLSNAGPAMDDLGITLRDLEAAYAAGPKAIDPMVDSIVEWMREADSVGGRTREVGDALSELGNEAMTAADKADRLGSALDDLLSPALDAEEATDRWRQTLRGLSAELDKKGGFKGFSDAAVANRDASRQYVEDVQAMIAARAEAGAGTGELVNLLLQSRNAFINEGIEAGINADAIAARADAIGLTPELVTTVFEMTGLELSTEQALSLTDAMIGVPKEIRTYVATHGLPKTQEDVNKLRAKFANWPGHVKTIIELANAEKAEEKSREIVNSIGDFDGRKAEASATLNDKALEPIRTLMDKITEWGKTEKSAKVDVDNKASPILAQIKRELDEIKSKSVTVTVNRGGSGGSTSGAGDTGRPGTPRIVTVERPSASELSAGAGRTTTFVGGGKVINYYAADGSSFDSETDLYNALDRARGW